MAKINKYRNQNHTFILSEFNLLSCIVSNLLTKIQLLVQNYGKVELRSISFPLSLL